MEDVTPYFLQVFTTRSIAQSTAGFLSSNSLATSVLSRSVPKINIVRSFDPIETPSIPASQNWSSMIAFEGISTIIQSLKDDDLDRPEAAIIFLTSTNSCTVRTNGSISHKFLYPCLLRTSLIVSSSSSNTFGSDI